MKNGDDNIWPTLGRYLALLSTVPAAIFVGYEIGAWLDMQFATHFLAIVFIVLGTGGGFFPIFHELTRRDPAERDQKRP